MIGEFMSGEDENEAGSIGAAGVAGVRAPPPGFGCNWATGLFKELGSPLASHTHTHPSFAAWPPHGDSLRLMPN